MPIAKNRADLLALARAHRGERQREGPSELHVRGPARVQSVNVEWSRVVDHEGRLLDTIRGPLTGSMGFDGDSAWRVDATGMPGALDLTDLEELVIASNVWSGRWTREPSDLVFRDASVDEASCAAVALSVPGGGCTYRLVVDGRTGAARRLERAGRDDVAILFDDHRDTPFGPIPHRIVRREAWFEDVYAVEQVEHSTTSRGAAAYALATSVPTDATFATSTAHVASARSRQKLPLVRPLVDGHDLGWFLLDTGAGSCALDARAAASLHLAALGHRVVRTADGVLGAPLRRASTLALGALAIERPLFLELDLAPFSRALGKKLGGILGYDLFMRARVSLDDAAVRIEDPRGAPPFPEALTTPLRFEGGRPVVLASFVSPASESQRSGLFAIDTGSACAVTIHAGAAPFFATRGGGRARLRGLSGAGGAHARTLPWFELAGSRLEDVDVLVAESGAGVTGDASAGGAGVLGSLGMGLLRDFDVTLDYRMGRARFSRRKRAALRARLR